MQTQILVALVAGAVLPLQAILNGHLSRGLGSAFLGSNVSFLTATIALALLQVVLRTPMPSGAQIAGIAPVWWLGGVLGAVYVTGAITSVGTLGPGTAICLIVAGQICAALAIEHFGIAGATAQPVSLLRLGGAAMVLAGAVVVLRG